MTILNRIYCSAKSIRSLPVYIGVGFAACLSQASNMNKIGSCQLKSTHDDTLSSVSTICKDNSCVLIFFRRWGCAFCRLWAKELSDISNVLQKHDVKLIGIGFDEIGLNEFKEKKFFDGDLYIISDKKAYDQLGFKRFSYFSILTSLLSSESRSAIGKSKSLNLGGDVKGDGLQNGGALILDKNGNTLKLFIQNGPADHLSNSEILKALNISEPDAGEKTGMI